MGIKLKFTQKCVDKIMCKNIKLKWDKDEDFETGKIKILLSEFPYQVFEQDKGYHFGIFDEVGNLLFANENAFNSMEDAKAEVEKIINKEFVDFFKENT